MIRVPWTPYAIDVDRPGGWVIWYDTRVTPPRETMRMSVLSSELARKIQERGENVVTSGLGDMVPRLPGEF